ncbi:ferrous iron transporter FeoB [Aciduliprofundum sp. MAR08-339]|uniref:ferrous iron transport protein B n=1 Tax=Aciduliprofundum sp. (strain MAR08-339) TaxID=673860 RepID=UPI0002A4C6BB|nr:ferrous iron transporter FeoB [Aciduliprofundum sp. MAR08-339]
MLIALAGNPNTGKTSLFNAITGAHQHIGNWPGVTVEKKEGTVTFEGEKITIVDLPGTYSLTAYSLEEIITRNFILDEQPDVVIDVIDATNLERNFYLLTELMELTNRIVVALNMFDEAKRKYKLDVNKIESLLGLPVVPTVAIKGQGVKELLHQALHGSFAAKKIYYPEDVERRIGILEEKLKDLDLNNPRWHAIKLIENDVEVRKKIASLGRRDLLHLAEHLRHEIEDIYGDDIETLMASFRYSFAHGLFHEVAVPINVGGVTITDMIDHVVAHRIFGLPIFLVILYLSFEFVFTVAAPFQDAIDFIFNGKDVASGHINGLIDISYNWMASFMPSWASSFINYGMFRGLAAVLTFTPIIMLLFLILSILEDSGYLARVAFLMDRLMRKIGMEGRGIISLMLGFGCNVPAVMSTRALKNERERKLSIALNPLIPCGARIQVFAFLTSIFFERHQALVLWSLLLLSMVVVALLGYIYSKTIFKGRAEPFVMELPPYRVPSVKGILIHMWEKSEGFLRKAGTIIIGAAGIIWLLAALPWGVKFGGPESYIGQFAKFMGPLGAPFGITPEAIIALFFGFFAKEVVITAFYSIYQTKAAMMAAMTPLQAYSLLAFILFYTPCVATLATIYNETRSKKFVLFVIAEGFALAMLFSFLIYNIGSLLGVGS